jgi:hypothetical protein
VDLAKTNFTLEAIVKLSPQEEHPPGFFSILKDTISSPLIQTFWQ